MKHTDLDIYTKSAQWGTEDWTTVYQANETITSTAWIDFAFQTPFDYNGSKNLMVAMSFHNSSWTTDGLCHYSNPGGSRSLYYRTDSGYGDPIDWSGSTNPTPSVTSNVPNIKLTAFSTSPVQLTPDINTDGIVDLRDFALFAVQWLQNDCGTPDWCCGADFNLSGIVDIVDLSIIASEWLEGKN